MPRARTYLKAHHRLLNPPAESLVEESRTRLETLLTFSPLLRSVWEWKEAMTARLTLVLPNWDLSVGVSKAKRWTTLLFVAP
nr:transposase [Paenibacillus polymyxa]